jgi:hypothetical protein
MKKLLLIFLILIIKTSYGQFNRKYDKYNQEVVISYNNTYVSLYKYIKNEDTTYQIAFYTYDNYLTASGNSAILLFSDDSKIELEGDVDVDYANGNLYRYSFYSYDKKIIEKISEDKLVAFRLHIFDRNVDKKNQNLILQGAKKVLSTN